MNPGRFSIDFNLEGSAPNTGVYVRKVTGFDVIDMHTHEFIEIAFVAGGNGWHVLGDNVSRCAPGSLFIIDFDDAHMFMAEHDEELTIYNLIFRPVFFDTALTGSTSFSDVLHHFLLRSFQYDGFSHSMGVEFSAEELPEIVRLFEKMDSEYAGREPGFEELIRSWTIELMVYIFRKQRVAENIAAKSAGLKSDVLDHVFEYIRRNYSENISLEKLSMLAFLSPKYFSRLFKQQTGLTVTEYTQKLRISKACELLRSTSLTHAEIAEHTGYSDMKFFNRVFKKYAGVTPSEYRKSSPPQS